MADLGCGMCGCGERERKERQDANWTMAQRRKRAVGPAAARVVGPAQLLLKDRVQASGWPTLLSLVEGDKAMMLMMPRKLRVMTRTAVSLATNGTMIHCCEDREATMISSL